MGEFAPGLTDEQRRDVRRGMEVAGCFKCPRLHTVVERNCNSYSCPVLDACPKVKTLTMIVNAFKEAKSGHQPSNPDVG